MRQHADYNSRNHVDLWPLKLCHGLMAQLYLKFVIITQHEVPFIKHE